MKDYLPRGIHSRRVKPCERSLAGRGIANGSNLGNGAAGKLEYALPKERKTGYAVVYKGDDARVIDHRLGGKYYIAGGRDGAIRHQQCNLSLREQVQPSVVAGESGKDDLSRGVDRRCADLEESPAARSRVPRRREQCKNVPGLQEQATVTDKSSLPLVVERYLMDKGQQAWYRSVIAGL